MEKPMIRFNVNQVSNYSYGEAEALTDDIEEEIFITAIQFDYSTIAGQITELAFLIPEVQSLPYAYCSVTSLNLLIFITAIQFDYSTIAGQITELAFLIPEVQSLPYAYCSVTSLNLLIFITAIQFDYSTIAGQITELAFLIPEVQSLPYAYCSVTSLNLLTMEKPMIRFNVNQVSNYSYGEAEALTDDIEEES
ncbi:hypothetical protein TEA_027242 [Camellia sinensis var. sinensis]|uniref:Uncharacterized protein n=1 Tax=Camellia sinensis var. sinensis TaxID=542762 RepID=A0A4S4DVR6_CAMSN|nr:hypothetical protein TEA_027242 [Camellia sinensis var. sinensis]